MIRLRAEPVEGVLVAIDMTREGRPRADRVQSVDRAVELLRAVAAASGSDSGVAALAQMCGLNRATAWRLLMTLEEQGMVARNPRTGWFTLGPTFLELRTTVGRDGLVEAARPVLERLSLETGETACLGLIDGDSVHYVAEVIPAIADEESWLGRRVDLHAASMGKAFLAYVEPDRVREIIGDEPPRYTDATITNLEQFLTELDEVRAQGYAVCKGEMISGSWGVSAPIFGSLGRPVAVLCLWGPDHRGGGDRFDALGRLARRAAQDLSRAWPQ
jgi:DNA-binding IclR family transcriptional regulator